MTRQGNIKEYQYIEKVNVTGFIFWWLNIALIFYFLSLVASYYLVQGLQK